MSINTNIEPVNLSQIAETQRPFGIVHDTAWFKDRQTRMETIRGQNSITFSHRVPEDYLYLFAAYAPNVLMRDVIFYDDGKIKKEEQPIEMATVVAASLILSGLRDGKKYIRTSFAGANLDHHDLARNGIITDDVEIRSDEFSWARIELRRPSLVNLASPANILPDEIQELPAERIGELVLARAA